MKQALAPKIDSPTRQPETHTSATSTQAISINSGTLTPKAILRLQRGIGNHRVQRLLKMGRTNVIQRTGDPIDISNNVLIIPQETTNTCWAAAIAMLVNIEYGGSLPASMGAHSQMGQEGAPIRGAITPQGVARAAGPGYEYMYMSNQGLQPPQFADVARPWGYTAETNLPALTVEQCQQRLERHGPFLLRVERAMEDERGNPIAALHAVVVTGMTGNGTPEGTNLTIADPQPVGTGSTTVQSVASLLGPMLIVHR